MTSPYQNKSAEIQKKIYDTGYWPQRYEVCLKSLKITTSDVEKKTASEEKLCELWNEFWFAIPDNASIRIDPFFDICNLCEQSPEEYNASNTL